MASSQWPVNTEERKRQLPAVSGLHWPLTTAEMAIALELVQGTARDFPFQVTNPDGTIPTGIFLSTDSTIAQEF